MNAVFDALAEELLFAHPEEAARVLEKASADTVATILEKSAAGAGKVLPHLNAYFAVSVFSALPSGIASQALESMPFDNAVLLLRILPLGKREDILREARTNFAQRSRALLKYPEDCVGAYMDPFALTLRESLTAQEAIDLLHLFADRLRNYLYVLDDRNRLKGVISVRQLLPLEPNTSLRQVMHTPVISVSPYSKIGDLSSHPGWQSFRLLPVADGNSLFHGVLKFETLAKRGRVPAAADGPGRATGKALGELYGVGIHAVLQSAFGWASRREES